MIFHLKEVDKWSELFRNVSSEIFSDDVCARLQADPPDDLFRDNLSWFACYNKQEEDNIILILLAAFKKCFTHIIGYHTCCPKNLDDYLTKGLLVHNETMIRKEAIDFFSSSTFPELSLQKIEAACDYIFKFSSEGQLYFALNDKFLIDNCGHYLLYGSETIVGIAVNLSRNGIDYRLSRRLIGKPTVFQCRIPIDDIQSWTLEELVRSVAVIVVEELLGRTMSIDIDFGFDIKVPLAHDNILEVKHPCKIRDPLTNEIVYC